MNPSPFATRSRRRHRSRGQSLVELALFAPLMILILLVAVDLGRAFMSWINVNNMARIGANYAAINPDGWQGAGVAAKQARFRELLEADYEQSGCVDEPGDVPANPDFSGFDFGDTVEVEVTCQFRFLTPLMGNLLSGGSGEVDVAATAIFTIRVGSPGGTPIGGGGLPTPDPTASPVPTPTPTGPGGPTPTPDPSASPSPTFPPVQIDFYGTPTSIDSQGGGPTPSPGFENVVGIPNLTVSFSNTTVGDQWVCAWDFGDGTGANTCTAVSKTYSVRGAYHVTLMVNGQSLTRPGYVLVGCKVPSFSGTRRNDASDNWAAQGFTAGNLTTLPGSGNYSITFQSLAGGLLNPPGGCSGAVISVGP